MRRLLLVGILIAALVALCCWSGCASGGYGGSTGAGAGTRATVGESGQNSDGARPSASGTSTTAADSAGSGTEFRALLSGTERVPAVSTNASGSLLILINERTGEVEFELKVSGISRVTGAYINLAPAGENGPPVVPLFTGPATGDNFSGVLARGQITSDTFMAALRNRSMSGLTDAIAAGIAYCNVQTEQWPTGELRGQIR